MLGKMRRPSGTWIRPCDTIVDGLARSVCAPSNWIAPRHGRSTPEIARLSVDFPAPFEPSTATISPGATTRSMPRRISVAPYPACSPVIARIGSAIGSPAHPARRAVTEIGFDHARIGRDRLRRACRDDASFGEHEHMRGQTHHRLHDMLD